MHASLALRHGVLYVLQSGSVRADVGPCARLSLFDLDGRRLSGGFVFDGRDGPDLGAVDLDVDDDRRLWLADERGGYVRATTLFGRELARFGPPEDPFGRQEPWDVDRAGVLGRPSCVAVEGSSDDLRLLVGSSGRRRHGVQLFDGEGKLVRSLRPRGDSHGRFERVASVSLSGAYALACEGRRARVHVWRDLDFHALIEPRIAGAEQIALRAALRLEDGRYLIAYGGDRSGVLLHDRDGALERELAGHGEGEGQVLEPASLVAEPGRTDALTRVVVSDRDGERLQVLTLDGRALGSVSLAGESA
jgi:hypothetical protein